MPQDGKVVMFTTGYNVNEVMVEVPDFFKMDLINASYEAHINDLQITVNGNRDGDTRVMMQGIPAGEKVKKGTVITLTFASNLSTDTYVTIAE